MTIHYRGGGDGEPRDLRLRELQRDFGFLCGCDLCSLRGAAAAESDARQLRIAQLASLIQVGKRACTLACPDPDPNGARAAYPQEPSYLTSLPIPPAPLPPLFAAGDALPARMRRAGERAAQADAK